MDKEAKKVKTQIRLQKKDIIKMGPVYGVGVCPHGKEFELPPPCDCDLYSTQIAIVDKDTYPEVFKMLVEEFCDEKQKLNLEDIEFEISTSTPADISTSQPISV